VAGLVFQVIRDIAVDNGVFWAKLAVGGVLVGASYPGRLARVRWLSWVIFGIGLEVIAWAIFAWPWFPVIAGIIAVGVLIGIVWEYRGDDESGGRTQRTRTFDLGKVDADLHGVNSSADEVVRQKGGKLKARRIWHRPSGKDR
jgi:hypothetical protein